MENHFLLTFQECDVEKKRTQEILRGDTKKCLTSSTDILKDLQYQK